MDEKSDLDQLIGALRQLRERAYQVGAGQQSEIEPAAYLELQSMLINALAIFSKLATSRFPRTPADLREGIKGMEQNEALAKALQAISPDFSVEAIDDAISVAASQS